MSSTAAGCDRIFVEHATGARAERPQLAQVLDHLRSGDTLVVWRLDCLARSLRDLMDVVTALEERGVAFRTSTSKVDTMSPVGAWSFTSSPRWLSSNVTSSESGPWPDWRPPEPEVATAVGPR